MSMNIISKSIPMTRRRIILVFFFSVILFHIFSFPAHIQGSDAKGGLATESGVIVTLASNGSWVW
ncbi:hypothetical protein JW926_14060, partial [Candidatus Sumerlaeota bacterium]|nr:hypothetical protein [Candidatus Sumerlaeota bacterium]